MLEEPIKVKGVNNTIKDAWEAVTLEVFFPDSMGKKLAKIQREFHIFPDLDCSILFGNDIIQPERIVIDVAKKKAIIGSCKNFTCDLRVTPKKRITKHTVWCTKTLEIKPHTARLISIRHAKVSTNQDYIFKPVRGNTYLPPGSYILRCFIRGNQEDILVTNVSDKTVRLYKNTCIGTMESFHDVNSTHYWESATRDLAAQFGFAMPECSILAPKFHPSKKHNAASFSKNSEPTSQPNPSSSQSSFVHKVGQVFTQAKEKVNLAKEKVKEAVGLKTKGSAAVHINATDDITPGQIQALRKVLEQHENLFSDELGLAKEPEEDWMRITLYPGAEREIKPERPYRLGPKEKEVVNQVFDKQREKGRLIDAPPSPAGWPVFVVKKGAKWRPVVDLRGLNRLIAPDAYPPPRQDDIVAALRGKYWLSVFDIRSAYYQRRVHPDDWWKLAVATHRGLEAWTVTPMGLCISVAHQQRYMDKLLRHFRWRVACCFIDDIIVFSDTFEDHLRDLDDILGILENVGLTVQPYKCFVGFHSIKLLGQLVDRLGLTTTEERAQAILQQKYPATLDQLETFLCACGYNWHLVPYYAQITGPLQSLKTRCFKNSPKTGRPRKRFAETFKLPTPTPPQNDAFELIKSIIGSRQTMRHPDYNREFFWYIDASRYGYGVAVYQDDPESTQTGRLRQRPVMFLSRELKPAESRYWPTELEAGGLIWAIKKLSHIVEGLKVTAFTDHKACEAISKMTSLHTSSPGHSNLRLANWALLLSQYWHNLDVKYVKGVENVMADALSHLRIQAMQISDEDRKIWELKDKLDEIDTVAAFNTTEAVSATLLQLEDDFKKKLTISYGDDTHFTPIIKTIKEYYDRNQNLVVDHMIGRPHSHYQILLPIEELLLFYKDPIDDRLRLCIPKKLQKEIFLLAHD